MADDDTRTRDAADAGRVVDLTDRRAAENGRETAGNGRRDRRGHFQPGHGGGPGRPKGSKSATSLLAAVREFDQRAAERLPEIVDRLLEAAAGGDLQAAKLVLDRVAPARKAQPTQIDLPDTSTLAGIAQAQDRVLAAVGAGELAPDEARGVMDLLENRRRAHETEDLAQRLARLERLHGGEQ